MSVPSLKPSPPYISLWKYMRGEGGPREGCSPSLSLKERERGRSDKCDQLVKSEHLSPTQLLYPRGRPAGRTAGSKECRGPGREVSLGTFPAQEKKLRGSLSILLKKNN
uniref:Uncharacterized protein n=1 Tax=Morchella brunnea TaxID=1174671 RepID=A0A8K1I803_9PEZI|nr:hypothetical protein LK370_mgp229 [Morchella brunnea]UBU98425.1 hypothetical protein [Morchella brunnea]